jgi:CO/xanthine dehydrogenase Mo-binding subunit
VGTPIDLRLVEGQMQGGTSQALAYATIENMEMLNGRPAQASFTDYTIPTTLDFPDTACFFVDNPYRYGPYGAKSAGELPNEGPAGAVAAAVSQAVGKLVAEIPITPEKLEAMSK